MKKWYQTMSGVLGFMGWASLLGVVILTQGAVVAIVVAAVYGLVGTALMIINTQVAKAQQVDGGTSPKGPRPGKGPGPKRGAKRQDVLIPTGVRHQKHLF